MFSSSESLPALDDSGYTLLIDSNCFSIDTTLGLMSDLGSNFILIGLKLKKGFIIITNNNTSRRVLLSN